MQASPDYRSSILRQAALVWRHQWRPSCKARSVRQRRTLHDSHQQPQRLARPPPAHGYWSARWHQRSASTAARSKKSVFGIEDMTKKSNEPSVWRCHQEAEEQKVLINFRWLGDVTDVYLWTITTSWLQQTLVARDFPFRTFCTVTVARFAIWDVQTSS